MIHETAIVQTEKIGKNVSIFEFAVIRPKVILGNNVVIHPHVVINEEVEIGDNVEIFPGSVIGKEPKGVGATVRKIEYDRHVSIGAGSSIGPHAVIYYDVVIGENTLVGDGASIREQCKIGSRCIISRYVTINYNTTVGDRTKIMDLTHITGNCKIGNDVFVSISVGMVNDNNLGAYGYRKEIIKGPVLKNEAKIGAGAILLPGVVIGSKAVVGAGSVVTKDVDSGSVVMGVPAKYIKRI